ncbi:unnamed protein product [Cuscuta campestris]|uniref:Chromo domain-containing protein n=1 Tax=Cuscuta campestris TaxID=132261 RepID=A0A484L6U9_9ASTE|nr:unnamed protein product [Cuscuta campestris]
MAASPEPSSVTLADVMQAITNLSADLQATKLCVAEISTSKQPGVEGHKPPAMPSQGSWRPPPSRTTPPSFDPAPRMRVDAPRFSGDDPTGWIFRVQKYFDYFLTPEPERLQLVAMLIDHPASEWFHYYQANNADATWQEFLEAVHQRFDSDYYENYVGLLSKLTQTSTVLEYQTAFEAILNKVSGVFDATLIAMYVAGLKQPLRREVNLRCPTSLPATFALARELSTCLHEAAVSYGTVTRRPWQTRSGYPSTAGLLPTPTPAVKPDLAQQRPQDKTSSLPVVRLSHAEKTERSKKGLCWYCDERWTSTHNCKHRFLVLMGPDDDEDDTDTVGNLESTSDTPVISADVSSILSLAGSPSPRSLRMAGMIKEGVVQVLLDGGSTNNFIHPAVAERLALPLQPVNPFRVYVGNGDSLRCIYSCPQTPLLLQGHCFEVDLYHLAIHGPDVVLGVQWLQTFGKVAHDYSQMTMEFTWKGGTVLLRGDQLHPRPVTYGQFCTLVAASEAQDVYELFLADSEPPATHPASTAPFVIPADVPTPIRAVLEAQAAVFGLPQGLPPSRCWDHRLHLVSGTKPINVRSYPADALSRQDEEGDTAGLFMALVQPMPLLLRDLRLENQSLQELQDLHAAVLRGSASPDFSVHDGLLYFKRRLYLGRASPLRLSLLEEYHSTPAAGHYWCKCFIGLACAVTRPPPSVFPTIAVRSRVPEVEEMLREQAELLADLRAHLIQMQQRMRPGDTPRVSLPEHFFKGRPIATLVAAVDRRTVMVDGVSQEQWLVKWSDGCDADTTWEPMDDLVRHFPDLRLEYKDVLNGGS